jgi:hypothetical protein
MASVPVRPWASARGRLFGQRQRAGASRRWRGVVGSWAMTDGLTDQDLDATFELLEAAGYLERRIIEGEWYCRVTDKGLAALEAHFGRQSDADGQDAA